MLDLFTISTSILEKKKKGSRQKSRKVRFNARIPEDKTQAAAQNLKAIGQQLTHI